MFPPGWPGLALLLLRASVATAVLLEGSTHRESLSGWALAALAALIAALGSGYFTPLAATLAVLVHLALWATGGSESVGLMINAILDAVALALLGPGAYSLDARRFGRRVVLLP